MSVNVQRKLVAQIAKEPIYGIMSDETTDVSRKEQMSINFRVVDEKVVVHELFLGFYDTPKTDFDTLFEVIKDSLTRYTLSFNKCRGQCFDGANNVSGSITGLQTRIREIEPRALYTHCAGHNLSLCAQDAMSQIPEIADLLSNVKELITFIRASAKRLHIFKDIQSQIDDDDDDDDVEKEMDVTNQRTALRRFCPTRWCARIKALRSVNTNYKQILDFCNHTSSETGEGGVKARGFLSYLQRFESLILLKITIVTLERVESLNEALQATSINFKSVMRRLELLKSSLNALRSTNKFDEIWEKCTNEADRYHVDEPVLPRKRVPPKRLDGNTASAYFPATAKDKYRQIHNRVIDQVLASLDIRFDSETYATLSKMEDFATNACDIDEIKIFLMYNGTCDFELDRLVSHRAIFYDLEDVQKQKFKNLTQIQIFLQKNDHVREFCCEYTKFICLLLTYPQTVCIAERSFSALKRLKSYLRANTGQKKTNDYAILHIHQEIVSSINLDDLMDDFITRGGAKRGNAFALKKN